MRNINKGGEPSDLTSNLSMPQQLPRTLASGAASGDHRAAVDKDIGDPFGILSRVVVAGTVVDSLEIENYQISCLTTLYDASITEVEDLRW